MRKPRTKDDYWYTQMTNAQPKRVYRKCPKCGMKAPIQTIYDTHFCYMCKATIYLDEEKNEQERRKYKFLNELKKKGIDTSEHTKKKKH